jgi:hypothetical protein
MLPWKLDYSREVKKNLLKIQKFLVKKKEKKKINFHYLKKVIMLKPELV